jgi:hypothetical protein
MKIVLTKDEWRDVSTWVETQHLGPYKPDVERWTEAVGRAHNFIRENVTLKFIYDTGIDWNEEIPVEIPREHLRFVVCGVGRIAYSLHVKPITARSAYAIVSKIEQQLANDDTWQKYGY